MHKAWCSIEEVPYCFPRSSIKFQGHTGWKIDDLDQIWARLQGQSQLSNPSDFCNHFQAPQVESFDYRFRYSENLLSSLAWVMNWRHILTVHYSCQRWFRIMTCYITDQSIFCLTCCVKLLLLREICYISLVLLRDLWEAIHTSRCHIPSVLELWDPP